MKKKKKKGAQTKPKPKPPSQPLQKAVENAPLVPFSTRPSERKDGRDKHPEQNPYSEGQSQKPTNYWRQMFSSTSQELSSKGWAQNFIIGLALLLVWPFIGATFMNSRRAIIIGFGIGITLLTWVIVAILIRQDSAISSTPSPPVSTPSPAPTSELHGLLIPANEPDPPNPCASNPMFKPPPDAVTIFYGGGATWITIPKHVVLEVKDTELLSISKKPGGVSVDAQIYGEDGRIVAQIIDNEFHVNPNNYFRIERTASTLIVYDQYNKKALNVSFLNPRGIKVTGLFSFKGVPPIVIGENETIVGGSSIGRGCSANSLVGISLG